jgi:hypothetical protein
MKHQLASVVSTAAMQEGWPMLSKVVDRLRRIRFTPTYVNVRTMSTVVVGGG